MRFAKRLIDLTLALLMLLVLTPVMGVVALALWWDNGRPILYRQVRWGQGGVKIAVHKFRTMSVLSDDIFGIIPASSRDPRVTRFGRVLRASGLDELPQLFLILKGKMSFVGPRALAVEEKLTNPAGNSVSYQQVPGFLERLQVPPGLTSPSTVWNSKDISPWEKFASDLDYVRRWTLSRDVRLIVLSFAISVLGRWERRENKLGKRAVEQFSDREVNPAV